MSSLNHLPPHLPAPTCSIEQHARHERLKFFFIAAFFGVLGGLTGASILLGWIWPGYGGGDTWSFSAYHAGAVVNPLEGRVAEDSSDRLVSVYKDTSVAGETRYLTDKNKVGEAVVLSTDGWLVMYTPSFDGVIKNWQVLDADGQVLPLEKTLFDRVAGLLYLKVVSQDRVVAFADVPKIGDDVFVHENGRWTQAAIESTDGSLFELSHLDSAPTTAYVVTRSFEAGAPVFSRQGRLVGFIAKNNLILPVESFAPIVTSVLSGQGVRYPSFGVEGLFDEDEPIIISGKRVSGFLVQKVLVKNSLLKRGDVILEVNGQIVTKPILWHTMYSNKEVRAVVLRAGTKIPLVLNFLPISNP